MLFPSFPQTLVLPYSAGKTIGKIKRAIYNKKIKDFSIPLFTGAVKKDGTFRIIPHQKTANNFIPVISGEVLTSSQGSIVMTTYSLSKNTRVFVIFICGICLLVAALIMFFQQNIIKSLIVVIIGALNYGITLFQFDREVKKTIENFNKVFGDSSGSNPK